MHSTAGQARCSLPSFWMCQGLTTAFHQCFCSQTRKDIPATPIQLTTCQPTTWNQRRNGINTCGTMHCHTSISTSAAILSQWLNLERKNKQTNKQTKTQITVPFPHSSFARTPLPPRTVVCLDSPPLPSKQYFCMDSTSPQSNSYVWTPPPPQSSDSGSST